MKKILFSFGLLALLLLSWHGFAQTTYTKITSTSDLEAGAQYILVGYDNDGQAFAMSYQKSNNRHAITIGEAGSIITTNVATDPSQQDMPYEFTLNGAPGAWIIFDPLNNGYLYAPGGGNYLRTQTTLDDNGRWTISDGNNGGMVPVSNGSVEQCYMRYNITSVLFGCYKESSNVVAPIYFYKASSTTQSYHITATANPTAGGTLTGGGYFQSGETCTVTATANYGYIFANWTENGEVVSTDETYTFTVTGNRSLVANFTDDGSVLLFEDFNEDLGVFTAYSVYGDQEWHQGSYLETTYAIMSGYANGSCHENEDWLISPAINNAGFSEVFVEFRSAMKYEGAPLMVKISTNYDGQGNPNDYDWQDITDAFNFSTGNFEWVESSRGNFTIPTSFFYLAFVYTSTAEAASSWEIDYVNIGFLTSADHYTITATANPEDAGTVVFGTVGESVISESFVYYEVGHSISVEATIFGYDWWTTWDNIPGGYEDGHVADYFGRKCGHFTYGNDQILLLSNDDNGIYDLSFDLLVPQGKNGYFSVMHHFEGSQTTWAMECYLHMTNDGNFYNSTQAPGHGTVHAGGVAVADIPCVYDAWMHFRLHVNTFSDVAEFYYLAPGQSEIQLCTWQWSLNNYGTNVVGSGLEAINFYPPTNTAISEFYIDNISFTQQSGEGNPETQGSASVSGTFDIGSICTLTAIPNQSSSFTNWTKNGEVVSANETFSFIVTENAEYVANFGDVPLNNYTITATANPEEGGTVEGTGTYLEGSICTLTAIPSAGYSFLNWTQNGTVVSTEAEYSFTVTENVSFMANFESNDYDPLIYSINDDGVSVTVTGHVDGTAAMGPIIIPETKTIDGITYTVTDIGNWAFSDCSGLTGDLVIPNSVVTIGGRAFMNCTGFTGSLTIGQSVTFIGNAAFSGCSGFTGSLTIPNSVTTISWRAFYSCIGFTGSLVIGDSVTMIGEQAFSACTGFMGTLTLGNSVTTIDYDAFFNCQGFTGTLTIPASVTIIHDWAFGYCMGFSAINSLAQIPALTQANTFNSMGYDIPVMVPCGSLSMYQYAWGWKNFTDIQEDCSGMYVVSATSNPTEGGCVIFGAEGETLFADSFEEYTVGNGVAAEAIATGHDWWSTWSGEPGGEEDGIVAEYNGTHCGHLTYGNDQILLLNKESGVYDVEFDILIPEGKNAFFSLLHQFGGSVVNEAMYCYLHVINGNLAPGHGSINAGDYILADIPCVYDAWMHIRLHVDIDADIACFYYTAPEEEELLLCQWPWSWNSNTAGYTDTGLAAMDFWPPADAETSEWYIDNFSLKQFGVEPTSGSFAYNGLHHFAPGSTCTMTAIPHEGNVFTNWTKNDEIVSTEATYSFTVTEDAAFVANFIENQGGVTQTSNYSEGYNWWGTYIELDGIDGLGMLQDGLGNNGVTIRSQSSGYTDYYENYGWYGSLSSINNESSYRVITSAPCTVTMIGNVAVPSQHPITLGQGWTWIGYVPSTAMDINEALADLDAMMGDRVKSQQGYSDYYGEDYGWYGSLNTMEPGMGLMYYSTNGEMVTFTYPNSGREGELKPNLTAENNHWKPNIYAYPDNMTVMAVVELNDMELISDNYEIAAFTADGECRGSVKLTYAEPLNRHVAFLTISGKDAAELSFRLYDTDTNMEYYDAEESLSFVANAIVGEANDLYVVHFRGTTSMDEFAGRVKVYPNPVNAGERFSINVTDDVKTPVHVEIVNALGVETLRATSVQAPAQLTAPATAGVYTLRITVEGKGTVVRKLVVK